MLILKDLVHLDLCVVLAILQTHIITNRQQINAKREILDVKSPVD